MKSRGPFFPSFSFFGSFLLRWRLDPRQFFSDFDIRTTWPVGYTMDFWAPPSQLIFWFRGSGGTQEFAFLISSRWCLLSGYHTWRTADWRQAHGTCIFSVVCFMLLAWVSRWPELPLGHPDLIINSSKGVTVKKKLRLKERSTQVPVVLVHILDPWVLQGQSPRLLS